MALAAAVCLISSYACVNLLRHSRRSSGRLRLTWTIVAALAVGFGIWATHFIGILALRPGFVLSYDFALTALSLAIAIVVCGFGIAMAIRGTGPLDHFLGGAVVGVGISTMHYTGIAALIMGGNLGWNPPLVAVSILAGMVLGGLAVVSAMGRGWRRLILGAVLLTLAICVMHFTAISAADFSRCFPLMVDGDVDGAWLSISLSLISVLILGAAFGSLLLDQADRRRTARELQRQLADADKLGEVKKRLELAMTHMAQGLCLYDAHGYLSLHNSRYPIMLGLAAETVLDGLHFRDICRMSLRAYGISDADLDTYTEALYTRNMELIAQPNGGELVYPLTNGRVLQVQHSPIGDGSWVTTTDDITERKRNEAAIAHLALHDGLTNLPNRAQFDQKFDLALAEAEAGDDNLAVVAIDLDGFKEINDSYGHAAGDLVLRSLAERLSSMLRDGEMVARVGGDEFAAIKRFTSMDALRDFIQRLENALFTHLKHDEMSVQTGASIGIAIYPEDGAERSKLLSNADLAMYRAKAEFDRHIAYYESEMDEHSRQRRAMARDLWTALDTNEFELVYQVQQSVQTGVITGYEVLLRWDRPGFGPVSPNDFVPVAEECGAISAIGAWVLSKACRDAATWPEPYKIAVNISAVQLGQIDLIELVRTELILSGLKPQRLELEVTETAIIGDKSRALHILRQIRAMGVSIAIDDFGTGYSSLDTLRSFPFDKIKLDRSFMSEVEDDEQSKAIVRAILALGRSLGVPVLAEGVETAKQLEFLCVEGCTEAQGYLLGRPARMDWADELEPPLRTAV